MRLVFLTERVACRAYFNLNPDGNVGTTTLPDELELNGCEQKNGMYALRWGYGVVSKCPLKLFICSGQIRVETSTVWKYRGHSPLHKVGAAKPRRESVSED